MKAQRHTEILAGRPNRIVSGTIDMRQLAQMHRFGGKDDAAMAAADRTANLGNRRFNRIQRHDALWDEALTCRRPLIDQPIVVSLHAGELEFRISDRAKKLAGQAGEAWIERGIIDGADDACCSHSLSSVFYRGQLASFPLTARIEVRVNFENISKYRLKNITPISIFPHRGGRENLTH